MPIKEKVLSLERSQEDRVGDMPVENCACLSVGRRLQERMSLQLRQLNDSTVPDISSFLHCAQGTHLIF